MSHLQPVLVAGTWRDAVEPSGSLEAHDPTTGESIGDRYPVSSRREVEQALAAALGVAEAMASADPARIAGFLDAYADGIEAQADALVAMAHRETGLPASPRLRDVELPRTTGQLRQAARAVWQRSWTHPVIDTATGLRAMYGPLAKPVVVFGPNNFPFAFNAIAGSDFASAIAAQAPVIAKVHPLHPGTSLMLGRIAHDALLAAGLPAAAIQLLYQVEGAASELLVGNPAVGGVGFTGGRAGGLALKALADRAGVPFYAEMSSINPVFLLEGALAERGSALAQEFFASCTMGSGQFCTNPGLLVVPHGEAGDAFLADACKRFDAAQAQVLFSADGKRHLTAALQALAEAGASHRAGRPTPQRDGAWVQPQLLEVDGECFLQAPQALQVEAFGPASVVVRSHGPAQSLAIARAFEGNLTATVYRAGDGSDDAFAAMLMPLLRPRVGRLIVDRMPTGVAVSPAQNHGGPYPATSHPGFTSVGMPGSIRRFAGLHSYDNVPDALLPPALRDANPGHIWRLVDGQWSTSGVGAEG
ncbi:aldehyde dehydrogenase family protein [Stenotrophomonas tumulicola]|uniref:Aldehyde dehydrogenase family protein n=1 Tax=Stenotrophomonas tumulicola TaxID=1685415 RepID=A0A7W3IJM8_9GAMM|nr:aldehyde dehydrogenase family protein [Stenotrophomonas tumulicola]MBA8683481.1 aldehyde dehydrogenase family protein [Stenotrophomonas tumulicola]